MTDFAKQIEAIVEKNVRVLQSVARQSIQDVINEAQTVGPSVANPGGGKGGKMPVDTGFLRASGRSSLTAMPSGPSKGDKTKTHLSPEKYSDDGNVNADIGRLQLGDTFYFGWTAEYALAVNVRYGFLDSALQNWQMHVRKNAENAAKRMKK